MMTPETGAINNLILEILHWSAFVLFQLMLIPKDLNMKIASYFFFLNKTCVLFTIFFLEKLNFFLENHSPGKRYLFRI